MEFDIIDVTEEELKEYSAVQMQLLRSAQKEKNELAHKMEQELAMFKKLVYTDDMKESSLLEQKRAELQAEFEYKVAILVEQFRYALEMTEPYIPENPDADKVGYIVDYTLPYTDRYNIVRDYYLAITDVNERMALYSADEVAKDYLSSYYRTLYNVLYTYSR